MAANSDRQEPVAVKRSSASTRDSAPPKVAKTSSDLGVPSPAGAENGERHSSNSVKKESAKKSDAR